MVLKWAMEWGFTWSGGGHVMVFTDRGTRAVMKIFTARVRSTRAVKIHYNPSAEVSKSHDMPDSEAGKVIISNITEI